MKISKDISLIGFVGLLKKSEMFIFFVCYYILCYHVLILEKMRFP